MSRSENASPRGWLRAYPPAWWSLAGLVGVPGVAAAWLEIGAGGALVLLAGLALLATFGIWQFGPQHDDGRPGRGAVVLGTACSFGLVALLGLGYALGPAGLAIGMLVATAGWPVLRPARTAAPRDRSPAEPQPAPGPALEIVPAAPFPDRSALRNLGTPELCWAWRASYVCLSRYPWPSQVTWLADLRRECLDELERRDPVAFGRWLATARAAGDPARYFCRQSQR